MNHKKTKPVTLVFITVLLLVGIIVTQTRFPFTKIIDNIHVTFNPTHLKSLQSAQTSLSKRYIIYTPEQIFNEWLRLEAENKTWHENLPACPKALTLTLLDTGETIASPPDPENWYPTSKPSSLHGESKYELRSKPVGISASQCIYDSHGTLFATKMPEAGSSDLYSINVDEYLHYLYDVEPYLLARELERSADYYLVRPPK